MCQVGLKEGGKKETLSCCCRCCFQRCKSTSSWFRTVEKKRKDDGDDSHSEQSGRWGGGAKVRVKFSIRFIVAISTSNCKDVEEKLPQVKTGFVAQVIAIRFRREVWPKTGFRVVVKIQVLTDREDQRVNFIPSRFVETVGR
ncbi:hypothetical protein Tsp_13274, partial [Trichinella spiralis]|uniref:hypothetical protein n=1 Tax=Trichinella spiralis TaxID=6334 RepID=UPI0001EFE5D5